MNMWTDKLQKTSEGAWQWILWRNTFLWQRSEVPASTALYHTPFPDSLSSMQIGLGMINVSHQKTKRAVGTRSGNTSRIYMNIWRSEENKIQLNRQKTMMLKFNCKINNPDLYETREFAVCTLMQKVANVDPSHYFKTTIYPFKNVWSLTPYY